MWMDQHDTPGLHLLRKHVTLADIECQSRAVNPAHESPNVPDAVPRDTDSEEHTAFGWESCGWAAVIVPRIHQKSVRGGFHAKFPDVFSHPIAFFDGGEFEYPPEKTAVAFQVSA